MRRYVFMNRLSLKWNAFYLPCFDIWDASTFRKLKNWYCVFFLSCDSLQFHNWYCDNVVNWVAIAKPKIHSKQICFEFNNKLWIVGQVEWDICDLYSIVLNSARYETETYDNLFGVLRFSLVYFEMESNKKDTLLTSWNINNTKFNEANWSGSLVRYIWAFSKKKKKKKQNENMDHNNCCHALQFCSCAIQIMCMWFSRFTLNCIEIKLQN